MNIGLEVQAELARQAAAHGRAVEAYAASLLEDAVSPISARQPAAASAETGQAIIDAVPECRCLLNADEIDQMSNRNPTVLDGRNALKFVGTRT